MNLGFLAALGAALAWGTYLVPFKKSGISNLNFYQLLMVSGIGLSGSILSLILGYPLNFNLYAVFSGFLWAIANAVSLTAVFNLGITRATPLVASMVIISSFVWGAFFFGEISSLPVGFSALALIITGVILVSFTGNTTSQNVKKGILAGVLAGLIFGSQLVPVKIAHLETAEFFFPLCFGIFLSGLILFIFQKGKLEKTGRGAGLLSGFIWNAGNFLSLIALELIGLAKMGPISQSAVLVAVLWGMLYFKEIKQRRLQLQIIAGALILLFGMGILSTA